MSSPDNPRPTSTRVFTYEEALDTFPAVRDLTHAAVRQIEAVANRIGSRDEMERRKAELEASYDRIVQAWAFEIVGLGCQVKGLWLVDWDMGDGYYCWKYPEHTLHHYHGYDEGFSHRVPIN